MSDCACAIALSDECANEGAVSTLSIRLNGHCREPGLERLHVAAILQKTLCEPLKRMQSQLIPALLIQEQPVFTPCGQQLLRQVFDLVTIIDFTFILCC
jgi:hypothetical protein